MESEGAFCSAGYQDKHGTEESFKASPVWMKAQEHENRSSRALISASLVLNSQLTIPANRYYSKTTF